MQTKDSKSHLTDDRFTPVPSHFLSNSNIESINLSHFWKPPTDVYETEEDFVIRVEIAGMTEKDFSLNCNKQTLTIQGKRNIEFNKCALHQIEIHSGEFQIIIDVSFPINKGTARIDYQNGFLTVFLPKLIDRK